jgi:hypothetical protein
VANQQQPKIEDINKTTFNANETMTLTGMNFRYKFDYSLHPVEDLLYVGPMSYLEFSSSNGKGHILINPYPSDNPEDSYHWITNNGTALNYTLDPENAIYTVYNENEKYFEGEVRVLCGPYRSEPVSVRINY